MKKIHFLVLTLLIFLAGSNQALAQAGSAVSMDKPTQFQAIQPLFANILGVTLGLVGVILLIMFIWAGIIWMIAAGDSGKIVKAKKIMIWSLIGFAVIFIAYGSLVVIFNALGYPTPGAAG